MRGPRESCSRGVSERPRLLQSLVLVGGVRLVALHAVSDIGIYGLPGGKLAASETRGFVPFLVFVLLSSATAAVSSVQ